MQTKCSSRLQLVNTPGNTNRHSYSAFLAAPHPTPSSLSTGIPAAVGTVPLHGQGPGRSLALMAGAGVFCSPGRSRAGKWLPLCCRG